MSIIEFLEARIAEDERDAKRTAEVFPGSWDVEDRGHHAHIVADGPNFHYVSELDQRQAPGVDLGGALESIARHSPARVLAECAAKRAIIEHHGPGDNWYRDYCETCAEWWDSELGEGPPPVQYPCPTVKAVAAVYAGHPDYQQEWAS